MSKDPGKCDFHIYISFANGGSWKLNYVQYELAYWQQPRGNPRCLTLKLQLLKVYGDK